MQIVSEKKERRVNNEKIKNGRCFREGRQTKARKQRFRRRRINNKIINMLKEIINSKDGGIDGRVPIFKLKNGKINPM